MREEPKGMQKYHRCYTYTSSGSLEQVITTIGTIALSSSACPMNDIMINCLDDRTQYRLHNCVKGPESMPCPSGLGYQVLGLITSIPSSFSELYQ